MKIHKEVDGSEPLLDWLLIKLKEYHKEKFGEDCIIIFPEEG